MKITITPILQNNGKKKLQNKTEIVDILGPYGFDNSSYILCANQPRIVDLIIFDTHETSPYFILANLEKNIFDGIQ